MARVHFKAEIKNAADPNRDVSKDYFFVVNRVYDETSDAFVYHLALVVRRDLKPSGGAQKTERFLCPFSTPTFLGRYLVYLHGTVPDFSEPVVSLLHPDPKRFPTGPMTKMIFEADGSIAEDTNACRYLYYEFNGLSEAKISGGGIFAFTDSLTEEPTMEHRFYYRTEFFKKIYVPFTISRNGAKTFNVSFPSFPAMDEDIRISFLASPNPIYSQGTVLPPSMDCIVSKSAIARPVNFQVKTETLGFHFLMPYLADETLRDYFLFQNIAPVKVREKLTIDNTRDQEKRCPFCKEKIALSKSQIKSEVKAHGVVDCQGQALDTKIRDNKGYRYPLVCNNYVHDASGGVARDLKWLLLPDNYNEPNVKNTFIGLVGLKSAGKSAFLSAVFSLQDGKSADLGSFLNRYFGRFGLNFELNPTQAVYAGSKQMGTIDRVSNQRYRIGESIEESDPHRNGPFSSFQENAYNAWSNTDKSDRFYPFILHNKLTNVVVADIDGESTNASDLEIDEGKRRSIETADAFIVVVAPGDADFRDAIQRVKTCCKSNPNKPIAVLLTKLDLLEASGQFNPSAACLVDQTYDFINSAVYSGSALERNVEQASTEIRQYFIDNIKDFDVEDFDAFPNLRFFAVSSLGDPRGNSSDHSGSADVSFYLTPVRVELPILWLLHQTGIIG